MSSTIISKTFYSEYFDNKIENIYLLDIDEASKLWVSYIDKTAKTFFHLSDDNPIIANAKNIGDWREYYDKSNFLGLKFFLTSALVWDYEELVLFFINKETAIKTNYRIFLDNISNFLELYDDCPILVNFEKSKNLEYIYISSLGNVFYAFQ